MENKLEKIAFERGVYVTEKGEMYGLRGFLVGFICNTGYLCTSIKINKKSKQIFSHRLQAFQKYGNEMYNKGIMVRHKDGDLLNNSWQNILIGTNSQNQLDIPKQVRIKRALKATSSVRKYNKEEVKKFHSIDNSYLKTMKEFNISSKGTLHFVLKN